MSTYREDHVAISAALKAEDLDAELWDTGGGLLMAVAVIERGGSPVVYNGEPSGETQAVRYVGVTREGIEYLVFEYDEKSEDPAYTDGVDLLSGAYCNTEDLASVVQFIRDYVHAAKHPEP